MGVSVDNRKLVEEARHSAENSWWVRETTRTVELCDALEASEKERERLKSQLNATTRAIAKGRYMGSSEATEIIAEWPEETLGAVMAEIHNALGE